MESTHFESQYPEDSRFEEIEKVLGFIKAGQSCQVIGLPGVGRSNLLRFLAFNRNIRIKHLGGEQAKFHFLYLDFAEVGGKPLGEVHKFIFAGLVESFKERGVKEAYLEAEKLFHQSVRLGDPLVIFQNLKKTVDILTNGQNLNLVLLFDRFEEYLPAATSEFFLNLRLLRNIAKYRLSVIFASNRPLEDILEISVYKEFYEFLIGHLVFLPLLDKPGLDFRLKYLEQISSQKIVPKTKEALLALTGGHGKLTRICVETLFAQKKSGFKSEKELSEFLLTQKSARGSLFEIWQALNSSEQNLIQKIIQGEKPAEGKDLDLLLNLNLVKEIDRTFVLNVPLLAPYLETLAPSGEEKIYFRPQTNEILKGGEVISDGLTAQEFRLLKFLLENPGKVCEREEIIRSVWPEAKTAEGISDEAIDQMVFRLRKKTEEDPKTPKHLQTVKGRGFRFSP